MRKEVHCGGCIFGVWYWSDVEYSLFSLPTPLTQLSAVNYIIHIILGIIIGAVLLSIVGIVLYCRYYKHNKTGRYNLFKLKPKGGSSVV